jgi:hypothetical protein
MVVALFGVMLAAACSDGPVAPRQAPGDLRYLSSTDCVRVSQSMNAKCDTVRVVGSPTSKCDQFRNCTIDCDVHRSLCDDLLGGRSGGSGQTPGGGGSGGGGGGGAGEGQGPGEDLVSYEQIAALTDDLAAELDAHLSMWEGPLVASADRSGERAAFGQPSAVIFTPETVIDLAFLALDIRELVVAGPSAERIAAVVADLAAVATPGVPSPGTVRVLAKGAQATKRQADNLHALLVAAKTGRLRHAEKSRQLWMEGHIGATRFKSAVPCDGKYLHEIDGALVDHKARTITIIELKPNNDRAMDLGHRQLDRYKCALASLSELVTVNKITSVLTKLPITPRSSGGYRVLRAPVPETY